MQSVTINYRNEPIQVFINGTIVTPRRLSGFDYEEIRMAAADEFLISRNVNKVAREYWSRVKATNPEGMRLRG